MRRPDRPRRTDMDEHDRTPFRVDRRLERATSVIAVEGDIDLGTADAVREHVAAAQTEARHVVLDLRRVAFVDSSGIRLLIEAQLAADRDGFALTVVRGPAPVQRLFDLSGLDDRLTLVDDPSEAAGDDDPR
jgi:anti-sigma B factor antagonist